MIFRTVFHFLRSHTSSKLAMNAVGRMRLRVLPTDIDTLGHVNNGMYLSLMDLGRVDLMIRAGAMRSVARLGFYPVVVSETISFRRSLELWQKYTLETRVIGFDAKAVYIEQRFVVGGEIYAHAFVRSRFLKKSGGVVSVDELAAALDVDTSTYELPEWVGGWAESVAMAPSRASAPSEWPA
ncbi:MAG: thioesterase [Microbacteriaceae bacterium]|nr:thioesterase [Microbacteriaceae bacterium]